MFQICYICVNRGLFDNTLHLKGDRQYVKLVFHLYIKLHNLIFLKADKTLGYHFKLLLNLSINAYINRLLSHSVTVRNLFGFLTVAQGHLWGIVSCYFVECFSLLRGSNSLPAHKWDYFKLRKRKNLTVCQEQTR